MLSLVSTYLNGAISRERPLEFVGYPEKLFFHLEAGTSEFSPKFRNVFGDEL